MCKLPVRTWVRHAAAVSSGQYGSATQQAEESRCSRQAVSERASEVGQRPADSAGDQARLIEPEAEIRRLQRRVAEPQARAQQPVVLDPLQQRQFATIAAAPGLSLRRTEDLLQILLPPGRAPDHPAIGRRVKAAAKRAGEVLEVLDRKCAPEVPSLALNEIGLGGGRAWSASSRRG